MDRKELNLLNKEFKYFKKIYDMFFGKYAYIIQKNFRISRYNLRYKLCQKYIEKNYMLIKSYMEQIT